MQRLQAQDPRPAGSRSSDLLGRGQGRTPPWATNTDYGTGHRSGGRSRPARQPVTWSVPRGCRQVDLPIPATTCNCSQPLPGVLSKQNPNVNSSSLLSSGQPPGERRGRSTARLARSGSDGGEGDLPAGHRSTSADAIATHGSVDTGADVSTTCAVAQFHARSSTRPSIRPEEARALRLHRVEHSLRVGRGPIVSNFEGIHLAHPTPRELPAGPTAVAKSSSGQ